MNIRILTFSFSILFIFLAILGGVLNFSFIPIADSWHKYEIVKLIQEHSYNSLLETHMEHRILFTRILLLMDYFFFGDKQVFLIAINYLLNFLCFILVFNFFTTLYNVSEKTKKIHFFVFLAFSFYWAQRANLTWEFQSQFYLFVIFSLLTFRSIYRNNTYFITAFFTVCSVFTMANGILVAPVVSFYFMINKNYKKLIQSFLVLCSIYYLYFSNYQINPDLPSPIFALFESPLEVLRFQLAFLGNIFSFMFGKGVVGLYISCFFGLISLIIVFIKRKTVLSEPLYLFLLFIIATSFIIAISRYHHSLLQPISSRYTTPIIFYWLLIYILIYDYLRNIFKNKISYLRFLLCILFIFLLHYQFGALKDNSEKTLKRVIHLGLPLNKIDNFIPHMSYELFDHYINLNYGLFSQSVIKELVFSDTSNTTLNECNSPMRNIIFEHKENYIYFSFDSIKNKLVNNKTIFPVLRDNQQIGVFSNNLKFQNISFLDFNKDMTIYGFVLSDSGNDNKEVKLINYDQNCLWNLSIK